jgi:hypothetical protein
MLGCAGAVAAVALIVLIAVIVGLAGGNDRGRGTALLYALLLLVRGSAMRFVPGDLRPMRRFARGGCVVARLAYATGGWRS